MTNSRDIVDLANESPAGVDTLIARFLRSADHGTTPDPEQFIREHPEHETALRRYFENLALFENLVREDTAPAGDPDIPTEFGHYRVEHVLGQGAMGTVYAAHDTRLNRQVALKVPRSGADADLERRFLREARSAARLRHPNICPVYEVGDIDGRNYISMALIRGHTLREFAQAESEQPQRHVALLIRKLALAVAEAHRQGVLHRDLKSANVMLDESHEPIVMDFGLAGIIEDDAGVTQSGEILGTPAYMAPEQVEGDQEQIGPATDVYGLGVILYELLTGRVPFQGRLHAVLKQVVSDEPPPPSRIRPGLDPILEAICLKTLARRPEERYASMDDLAEDLRRYLAHESTLARPDGMVQHARKWFRRRPTAAVLVGVSTAAVLLAIGLTAWGLHHRAKATSAAREYQTSLQRADDQRARAEDESARRQYARAIAAAEGSNSTAAMLWLASALEPAVASEDGDLESRIRRQLAAWTGQFPSLRTSYPHQGHVFAIAVSQDAQLLVTGGRDGSSENDGLARLWNAKSGQSVGPPLVHQGTVFGVDVSPDGSRIISGSADGTAQLWDAATGARVGRTMRHDHRVLAVAFSPDGETVLTGSHDTTARLWSAETGEALEIPQLAHGAIIRCVDFSPDGESLLTAGDDGVVRFWSAATGERTGEIAAHSDQIFAARFSPDGRLVLTGCNDGRARLWDFASGEATGPPMNCGTRVSSVDFSPDGAKFVTAGLSGAVRIGETQTRQFCGVAHHADKVGVATFGPDGTLLTGGWEGIVRSWDVDARSLRTTVRAAAFSRDERTISIVSGYGLVHELAAETFEPLHPPVVHYDTWQQIMTLSPDGSKLLAREAGNVLQVSETSSIQPVMCEFELTAEQSDQIRGACFSPDNRTVLAGSLDGIVRLWDVETGRVLLELEHASAVTAVTFTTDGQRIVTGSWDRMAHVWDVVSGAPIGNPFRHDEGVIAVAVSPNGRWIATAIAKDNTVHVWDTTDGRMHGSPMHHPDQVRAIAFSPDSETIVTTCNDHVVRRWIVSDCRQLGPTLHRSRLVWATVFSPDGKSLLIGGSDRHARLIEIKNTVEGNPERIQRWVEVNVGHELDEQGNLQILDAETWAKRTRELDRLGGPPI